MANDVFAQGNCSSGIWIICQLSRRLWITHMQRAMYSATYMHAVCTRDVPFWYPSDPRSVSFKYQEIVSSMCGQSVIPSALIYVIFWRAMRPFWQRKLTLFITCFNPLFDVAGASLYGQYRLGMCAVYVFFVYKIPQKSVFWIIQYAGYLISWVSRLWQTWYHCPVFRAQGRTKTKGQREMRTATRNGCWRMWKY